MSKTVITKNLKTRELIIERVLKASPELLWRSWTEPELVEKWWGPKNWTATMHEMDVRAGGLWRYSMVPDDGDGEIGRGKAIYNAVEPPVRLAFVDTFADDAWQSIEGSEMDTTVTFLRKSDRTKLTITAVFASTEALNNAEAMGIGTGFNEALDRLEQYVTNNKENSMQKVTSKDGAKIAYEKSGTGPALILISTTASDHHDFDGVAAELAKTIRYIILIGVVVVKAMTHSHTARLGRLRTLKHLLTSQVVRRL